ncbi:MAG: MATE family efflux transporter [Ruminococcaceae bacterium]|nr:MATE family efflux transporter [Oscillospiraceae bacterium]
MATLTKKQKDFTSGPMFSKMILFTLPVIATSVLQLLFNTADTFVVGNWGGATPEAREAALAAVGSCGSLTSLLTGLFLGLSVGAGVTVAHAIGAKNEREIGKTVHTSVVISLICGIVVSVFGIIFARPLLSLMGTPPTVLDEAAPYMRACFCGMTANMLYNYCAAILRSTGNTMGPLFFLSVAGVVNVGLNLVMVLVFHMGALGVGIATAASHWVSCILVVTYMMRMDGPCKIEPRKLCISKPQLRKMILIGLPAGIQSTLFAISNVTIQASINSFHSNAVIAGNTAASNLDSYVYFAQNGLYHTALTFVGQNLGANKYERVKKAIIYALLCVCVVGILLGTTVFLFGRPLLSIFNDSPAVVDAGMVRLTYLCLPYFLCGAMEVGSGTLRGLGKSMTSMIISLIGACFLRLLYLATVFKMLHTTRVLYLSYPLSWILTTIALFLFVFIELRRWKRTMT